MAKSGVSTTTRDKVFVSYSHPDNAEDNRYLDEFKKMLAPAIREGIVDIWDDTRIIPGQDWQGQIANALASAKVGVLLVSDNFLESDFIAKNELPPLLDAARNDSATIFWVCLSPCLHELTAIEVYQAAHCFGSVET